jgi:hypothetical protein
MAHWEQDSIQGSAAKYKVRSKVVTRSTEGKEPEGELEFEDEVVVGMT